ncbi:MAG: tRNA (N6-isopentenyl adenosine(37)-C2)-methylthiotransferase MiaB [Bacteroidota bacterium]
MNIQRKVYLETYGCQMNVADSEVVLSILKGAGYSRTEELSKADVIFVNTCAVRENAEQRIYGRIGDFKHLKKSNPGVVVGVLGCMAERLRKDLLQSESAVDLVVGPDEYRRLPDLVDSAIQGEKGIAVRLSRVENYDDIIPLRIDGISAWVSVMRGCDKFCTFCVVPFTRGRERSRSLRSVRREIAELVERGFREVNLLGQNVNSYRDEEGGYDFADLLAAVARIDSSLRVRFTTSHPQDMSDKLIAAIATHANICKYVHLPVQSGSNRVLQLMNRTYTADEYRALVNRIRRAIPGVSLSTDIIAGFPTETDDDHRMTMDLIREMEYDGAFTFKYSPRTNTKAWHMGDSVPEETKVRRLSEIIELQRAISFRRNQALIGTEEEILVEGPSKKSSDDLVGRTDTNKMVVFSEGGVRAGEYRRVRIERANSATLFGTLISHSAEQRIAVNG